MLHNPTNKDIIGQHVEVVILPIAGWRRARDRSKDQQRSSPRARPSAIPKANPETPHHRIPIGTWCVRRNYFKAHVTLNDVFELLFPLVLREKIFSKCSVVVRFLRMYEDESKIDIAVEPRASLRAAPKKPKLDDTIVRVGP